MLLLNINLNIYFYIIRFCTEWKVHGSNDTIELKSVWIFGNHPFVLPTQQIKFHYVILFVCTCMCTVAVCGKSVFVFTEISKERKSPIAVCRSFPH